jgi:hypothetical protein
VLGLGLGLGLGGLGLGVGGLGVGYAVVPGVVLASAALVGAGVVLDPPPETVAVTSWVPASPTRTARAWSASAWLDATTYASAPS